MTGDGEGGGGSRRRWRSLLHNEPATPPPLLIALSPRFLFRSDQLRSSFTATMMKNDGGLCIGPAVATIIRRSSFVLMMMMMFWFECGSGHSRSSGDARFRSSHGGCASGWELFNTSQKSVELGNTILEEFYKC
ncbi:hypothetical protein HanRHA438_Chr06g0269571 [Helianthus annuus]|nr:hypothetical protein HanRHA438_Chr06g0269571 [Helianthus annuus]